MINASSGTKVYIGPVTAAANAAAYAALTWVEVGEVETVGEFGDASAVVAFTSLSARRTKKAKGARDAGDLPITCGYDARDAGQLAMVAAEKTPFAYAIKVVVPDAPDANDTDSIFYFHAKVLTRRLNVGGSSDVTKRAFTLAIDTEVIDVPSAVVA